MSKVHSWNYTDRSQGFIPPSPFTRSNNDYANSDNKKHHALILIVNNFYWILNLQSTGFVI